MIGYEHAINKAVEIAVQLQRVQRGFLAGGICTGRDQCVAELITQAHHQWMCGDSNGNRTLAFRYPVRGRDFCGHDPAGRFMLANNGCAFIAVTDIDQGIKLLQARAKQYQSLAGLSVFQGVDFSDGFGAKWITAKAVNRFCGVCNDAATANTVNSKADCKFSGQCTCLTLGLFLCCFFLRRFLFDGLFLGGFFPGGFFLWRRFFHGCFLHGFFLASFTLGRCS